MLGYPMPIGLRRSANPAFYAEPDPVLAQAKKNAGPLIRGLAYFFGSGGTLR